LKVSESPARFGALKLVGSSIIALIIPTSHGEHFRVFGISRRLGPGKTSRRIDLIDKDFAEAFSQFGAILNVGRWQGYSNRKLRESADGFLVASDNGWLELLPEGLEGLIGLSGVGSANA